jgi:hypothetical protein
MRKLMTVLAAATLLAVSFGQTSAAVRLPPPSSNSSNVSTSPWPVACGAGAFVSLAIGTTLKANDPDASKRRQLTVTEAAWFASVCPVILPFALLSTTACPDNNATYQVARLAYVFVQKHPESDQSAFTNAYVEACKGSLSRSTLQELRTLTR